MKVKVFLCFNVQSNVESYLEIDIYNHLFLTTALAIDMPLNSTYNSYLSSNKKHKYVLNMGQGVRVGKRE